jgi:ferritin-like metal-binding protein YciE
MQGKEIIVRYIQDAEAAERNFEDALASFAKSGDQPEVQRVFSQMSQKARTQHERLRARLQALGGEPSTMKSLLAHMLSFTPTTAQVGHHPAEKNVQHLMITYSAAAAEMAMYESLATTAGEAGDAETEKLARQLQEEERDDHRQAWSLLQRSARDAFEQATQ